MGHITPRERDVWSLVAQHRSNPEVAAELCLSVRTVESHVASLIRKLEVTDRRSLARIVPPDQHERAWPSPASSFVGRHDELAALSSALTSQRLVTVTGPGGVGKTRLALEGAVRAARLRRDGGCFVDLVHVTDPSMVITAIARSIGVPEQLSRDGLEVAVIRTLESRQAIIVLDNCEHVIDAVRRCAERLVTTCGSLTIIATSRLRLKSAPEWVYDVPGLSDDIDGDGVALFVDRASAAGAPPIDDRAAVAELCRRVDGIALAIELAAARYPSLGLDGLSLGLGPGLPALRIGAGSDVRHRSMGDALAWSFDLLARADQTLMCAVACFASWFDAASAATISGVSSEATIADRLSTLADHHLLVALPGTPTRYRALEIVRQFAHDRSARLGLSDELHVRHLAWCRDDLAELAGAGKEDSAWRAQLDGVATEARAALRWAQDGNQPNGGELAELLAEQLLRRGYPAESQQRYEQAAALSAPGPDRARLLNLAAGAAACRMVGDDALRLLRSAADEYVVAGDSAHAAQCLAWIGIYTAQAPGIIAHLPSRQDGRHVLELAKTYARGSPAASAAVAVAVAGQLSEDSDIAGAAERAARLSQEVGAPLLESAALDELCSARLAMADFTGALAALDERRLALDTVAVGAASAFQFNDFLLMAAEVNLAVGNLSASGSYADQLANLSCYREQDHLAYARRIKVDALAGDLEAVVTRGERFVNAWERAGRPVAANLASTAYTVATTHDLLGSSARRRRWVGITRILANDRPHHRLDGCVSGYAPTLDALVLLDRGQPTLAAERLSADIDDPLWAHWDRGLWRLWYAAFWSEAAALSEHPDTHDRLRRAAALTEQNPIAHTIVERSRAWVAKDVAALRRHATTFAKLGCGFQTRRTEILGQHCGS
jgi:predicted ATPase/DNA-binding CsgD family transcriptional regulator